MRNRCLLRQQVAGNPGEAICRPIVDVKKVLSAQVVISGGMGVPLKGRAAPSESRHNESRSITLETEVQPRDLLEMAAGPFKWGQQPCNHRFVRGLARTDQASEFKGATLPSWDPAIGGSKAGRLTYCIVNGLVVARREWVVKWKGARLLPRNGT